MKFTAIMIVLNGMPWIPYILRNMYPHVDEFIIIEGAVEDAAEVADANGHSTDNTVEVIQTFPDTDHKIRLVQRDGFWQNKDEMFAVGTQYVTGDYLWEIDVDEFYHHHDIEILKNYLIAHPEYDAVCIRVLNFWGSFHSYMMGGGDQRYDCPYAFWRMWRWKPGYRYIRHEPPTVVTADGTDARELKVLGGAELLKKFGIVIYHFSYIFPEQVYRKVALYAEQNKHLETHFLMMSYGDIRRWYETHFLKLKPWAVHIRPELSWLEPYKGAIPAEVEELRADIIAGKVEMQLRHTDDIDRLVNSWWRWRFWKVLGQLGLFYQGPVKDKLRPFVRFIRSKFLGYDYSSPQSGVSGYDEKYFAWQREIGQFGAKVDLFKFTPYIRPDDVLLDFGCGGGYMLDLIECAEKSGIDVNDAAIQEASQRGIRIYKQIDDVPDNHASIIISHHALEHVPNPFGILQALLPRLKPGGRIVIVVPHERAKVPYYDGDVNQHLYTWAPLNLGNLLKATGYTHIEVDVIRHAWRINRHRWIYNRLGERAFHMAARLFARRIGNYQIRAYAERPIR